MKRRPRADPRLEDGKTPYRVTFEIPPARGKSPTRSAQTSIPQGMRPVHSGLPATIGDKYPQGSGAERFCPRISMSRTMFSRSSLAWSFIRAMS